LLLAAASVSHADQVLFSTCYESSTYSEGPLSGQDGWENSFGIDPVVTSVRSRTGAQGWEVRKTSSLDPSGLTYRTIAIATPRPRISVQHSIYLEGAEGPQGSHFSPLALIGENGLIGQIAIRDGPSADLFTSGVGASVPIQTGAWIDLRHVLDFQTQTQEGFVKGVSIGSVAFESPATRLIQVEIFHIIGTDDKPFIGMTRASRRSFPSRLLSASRPSGRRCRCAYVVEIVPIDERVGRTPSENPSRQQIRLS
jgi:hypothetical protein